MKECDGPNKEQISRIWHLKMERSREVAIISISKISNTINTNRKEVLEGTTKI